MKKFNTQTNIGKVKYVVNYHNGEKTHRDGSEFFDIATFTRKDKFVSFVDDLKKQGYKEI